MIRVEGLGGVGGILDWELYSFIEDFEAVIRNNFLPLLYFCAVSFAS
jgi:hypothetical protein